MKYDKMLDNMFDDLNMDKNHEVGTEEFSVRDALYGAGITFAVPAILNSIISVMREKGNSTRIDSNIIDLTCIVSDDLPMSVRNQYCDSLEVIYAYMIRSILSTNAYGRTNSSTTGILKSIPLLTSADKLKLVNNTLVDATAISLNKLSGKTATNLFAESLAQAWKNQYQEIAMEADALIKESRKSTGQYINVALDIIGSDGKATKKEISLAVRVRPKVVSRAEMIGFFVKNKEIDSEAASKSSFFGNLKTMLTRNSAIKPEEFKGKAHVIDLMKKVSGIKKPFVCVLTSEAVKEELEDEYGVKLDTMAFAGKLYKQYPLLSIGIYNTNSDSITASLNPNAGFVTKSASEFNSEIAQYEKRLGELVSNRSFYNM